ncbi:hypothetical protein H4Q26_014397 [Puccinia striiformis f. sp. tritici PST-130]|nr:hypothetical protein H4Q26_014397 [Puccinia striiformis f. sp. tritici PST-130]
METGSKLQKTPPPGMQASPERSVVDDLMEDEYSNRSCWNPVAKIWKFPVSSHYGFQLGPTLTAFAIVLFLALISNHFAPRTKHYH